MRIFKVKHFFKWQKKESITDAMLIQAIKEINCGLVDAQLGKSIVKKRIAKPGFGKRSSYRTLIATNRGNKWFFMFGFSKNEQGNVSALELEAIKEYAQELLNTNEANIRILLEHGDLKEINYEKK